MVIGAKVTNPGELRTPVFLGERVTSTDAGGFTVGTVAFQTFAENAGVYAKWVNAHGAEAWGLAGSLNGTAAATVLIRFDARLDLSCGIRKGSEWWEIVSMDNIGERGEYLEVKVKRVGEG